MPLGDHTVLADVSIGCPVPLGRFPRVTHPCATLTTAEAMDPVRLACVRRAASVRPEPGSNSQIHPASQAPLRSPKEPHRKTGQLKSVQASSYWPQANPHYSGTSLGQNPNQYQNESPPASSEDAQDNHTPPAHPLPFPTCQKNIVARILGKRKRFPTGSRRDERGYRAVPDRAQVTI